MIAGVGVDLVDCRRLKKIFLNHGQRFLDRIFTQKEQEKAHQRLDIWGAYGKNFAGKEAVLKAISLTTGIGWKDIEILNLDSGQPFVTLFGGALDNLNKKLKNKRYSINISISDEPPYAQAFVIIFC